MSGEELKPPPRLMAKATKEKKGRGMKKGTGMKKGRQKGMQTRKEKGMQKGMGMKKGMQKATKEDQGMQKGMGMKKGMQTKKETKKGMQTNKQEGTKKGTKTKKGVQTNKGMQEGMKPAVQAQPPDTCARDVAAVHAMTKRHKFEFELWRQLQAVRDPSARAAKLQQVKDLLTERQAELERICGVCPAAIRALAEALDRDFAP